MFGWLFKKNVAPIAAVESFVGHNVEAVNTNGSFNAPQNRIDGRLGRIELALVNAENRRVAGDAMMELKIEQLKAERTILMARKALYGQ